MQCTSTCTLYIHVHVYMHVVHIQMYIVCTVVLRPYKYAGYPMLIKTIQLETGDDDLFSKSAPILTAASEVCV